MRTKKRPPQFLNFPRPRAAGSSLLSSRTEDRFVQILALLELIPANPFEKGKGSAFRALARRTLEDLMTMTTNEAQRIVSNDWSGTYDAGSRLAEALRMVGMTEPQYRRLKSAVRKTEKGFPRRFLMTPTSCGSRKR